MLLLVGSVVSQQFTQTTCDDPGCSVNCVPQQLEEGQCYPTIAPGSSAISWCEDGGATLRQRIYMFSTGCSGYSYVQSVSTNQCFTATVEYVEYSCDDSSARPSTVGSLLRLPNLVSVMPGSGLVLANISMTVSASSPPVITLIGSTVLWSEIRVVLSNPGNAKAIAAPEPCTMLKCHQGIVDTIALRTPISRFIAYEYLTVRSNRHGDLVHIRLSS